MLDQNFFSDDLLTDEQIDLLKTELTLVTQQARVNVSDLFSVKQHAAQLGYIELAECSSSDYMQVLEVL